ncbi:MAG: nuclear transport factor 2 family protein [Promethearchaeota archaeon]
MTTSNKSKAEISKVLHNAFGWALTKDRALFVRSFANDDDFFSFFPDSKSIIVGWSQFERLLERWMDPRSVVKGFNIRDLRIVIAKQGNTAWFSAIVDDEGEYDGTPWDAKDIRWTGVLEKRGGIWRICQQHMSEANDKASQ